MASDSFFSTGIFGSPEEATTLARVDGRVVAAEIRQNGLTGNKFLWCRVQCLEFELDLSTEDGSEVEPAVVRGLAHGILGRLDRFTDVHAPEVVVTPLAVTSRFS